MNEHNYDILQRFIFENHGIRGHIVRLGASYRAVSERHPYPLAIQQKLGQALAASALLSATIKFQGSLILQAQCEGPISLLLAQSNQDLQLRGLAHWSQESLESLKSSESEESENDINLGTGHLVITMIPENNGERYQGVVEINEGQLASSIEAYFAQSEQLPTRLWLFADKQTAAGLLLQRMPDDSPTGNEYWQHVAHLASTITAEELLNLSNQHILHRLYHEEDVRLFSTSPTCFRCSCSIGKMEDAIVTFGKQECDAILSTNDTIDVNCEFCNKHYQFDKVDIANLFAKH